MVDPAGALHHSVEKILGANVVDRAGVSHLLQNRKEGGIQWVLNTEWSSLIGPDPSRYCALIG